MKQNVIVKPFGPCLVEMFVEEDQIVRIKEFCQKNKDLNVAEKLAGHLNHEYLIDKTKLQKIIISQVKLYQQVLNTYYGFDKNKNLIVKDAWVNYMQKGDFNPLHQHNECDFSGVLYLDVPEEIEKEASDSVASGVKPGQIEFMTGPRVPNQITSYFVTPKNGLLYIFPSNLLHMVCPFKSNVERVSVAFNLIWSNE